MEGTLAMKLLALITLCVFLAAAPALAAPPQQQAAYDLKHKD
jgi:hypothetical protein